ncbi:MAG: hypothetical protein WBD36_07450 [Bacteroidota bacterium]
MVRFPNGLVEAIQRRHELCIALTAVFLTGWFGFVLSGCYVEKISLIQKEQLVTGKHIEGPSKVHLKDGSVILSSVDWIIGIDSVRLSGRRYTLDRRAWSGGLWKVPVADLVAVEQLDTSVSLGVFPLAVAIFVDSAFVALLILFAHGM